MIGMEYLLRLLSNLFRTKVDHELEEFCYNLEYRVKDLKKRIADLQIIVNGKLDQQRFLFNLFRKTDICQCIKLPHSNILLLKISHFA